jgi:hypothetical protein
LEKGKSKATATFSNANELPFLVKANLDRTLILLVCNDHSVLVASLDDGKVVRSIPAQSESLSDAVISPDNKALATLRRDGRVHVYDIATGNLRGEFKLMGDFLNGNATFSKDGRFFIIRGETWQIYDLRTFQLLFMGPLKNLAGTSTNKSISWGDLGDTGKEVVVLNAQGVPVAPPLSHETPITTAQLSPSGRLVATASKDQGVRVWNANSGELMSPPIEDGSSVSALAFSQDENRLAYGTESGGVAIWNLNPTSETISNLEILSQILSGRRYGGNGGLTVLSQNQIDEAWQSYEKGHVRQFKTSLNQASTAIESASQALPRVVLERAQKPPYPMRDVLTNPKLIDLTRYYNTSLRSLDDDDAGSGYAPDLVGLNEGIQALNGVKYDIRGIVQFYGKDLARAFPEATRTNAARDIPVNQYFSHLHVLHGTSFSENEGTQIASIIFHFKNGRQYEIPIRYGNDIRDYWYEKTHDEPTSNSIIAWRGSNPTANTRGKLIRIYESDWNNPFPSEEVQSIDYVSSMSSAAPFLIALTVD